MNQFKQAKQRSQESGHITENAADIKTAGVKENIDQKTTSQIDISDIGQEKSFSIEKSEALQTLIPEAEAPLSQQLHNIPDVIEESSKTSIDTRSEYIYDTKHVSKSSAPNIFAPKGESKSMRKSLVLKPTSVKIAEDYCARNGGSFNELIQTLLDNFIEEYGL